MENGVEGAGASRAAQTVEQRLGQVVVPGHQEPRKRTGKLGEELLVLGRAAVVCQVSGEQDGIDTLESGDLREDGPEPSDPFRGPVEVRVAEVCDDRHEFSNDGVHWIRNQIFAEANGTPEVAT
jgi:hypothetical protein